MLPVHFIFAVSFIPIALAFYTKPLPFVCGAGVGRLGRLSYSLYISHFAIIHGLCRFFPSASPFGKSDLNFAFGFLIVITTSTCAAWLLQALIEKPGIRLGLRIMGRDPIKVTSGK